MKGKKGKNPYKLELIKKKPEIAKPEPKTPDGKIDVSKKYSLGGKILKQEDIDIIVKKRKKSTSKNKANRKKYRNLSKKRNRRNRHRKHKRPNNK